MLHFYKITNPTIIYLESDCAENFEKFIDGHSQNFVSESVHKYITHKANILCYKMFYKLPLLWLIYYLAVKYKTVYVHKLLTIATIQFYFVKILQMISINLLCSVELWARIR